MGSPSFDRQVFVKKTQSSPPSRSPLPGAFALLIVAALAAFGTYRYMKAGGGKTSSKADKAQIEQLQKKLTVMQAKVKELERRREPRTRHVASQVKPDKVNSKAAEPSHTLTAEDSHHPKADLAGETHGAAIRKVADRPQSSDPKVALDGAKTEASAKKQATSSKQLNLLQSNLAANNDQWQATVNRLGNVVGQLDSQNNAIKKNQTNVNYLMEQVHRTRVSFTLNKGRRYQRVGPISMKLAGTSVRNQHYNIRLIVDDKSVELKDRALNEVVQFFTSQSKYSLELIVSQINRDQVSGTLVVPYDLSQKLANTQLQEK